MSIFRKVGNWLTEKSDHFIRGGAQVDYPDQRVGEDEQAAPEEENARPALDPFGHGDGEYGGRVPYRSRYDLEKEAAEKQQREARQAAQQAQAAAQQQAAYQQQMAYQQQAYTQPVNNVVPFPGMQRGPDGSVYSHVEYVVLLRNRNECKDVIAYIKSNASVFLNMEFIASDSERQRCVDMLSGAAYTLGCSLNKISPRGIYLISAPTVRVVLDPAMQKFAAAPESQGFVRQRYENDGYGAQQQPVQPQETTRQQPVSGFSSGSPTSRFQAQNHQRVPTSFGSVMAGNATGMYQPVGGGTGRYAAVQQ